MKRGLFMAKKKGRGKPKGDTTFAVFNFITIALIIACVIVVVSQNV